MGKLWGWVLATLREERVEKCAECGKPATDPQFEHWPACSSNCADLQWQKAMG